MRMELWEKSHYLFSGHVRPLILPPPLCWLIVRWYNKFIRFLYFSPYQLKYYAHFWHISTSNSFNSEGPDLFHQKPPRYSSSRDDESMRIELYRVTVNLQQTLRYIGRILTLPSCVLPLSKFAQRTNISRRPTDWVIEQWDRQDRTQTKNVSCLHFTVTLASSY